jgi:hypothetical protein
MRINIALHCLVRYKQYNKLKGGNKKKYEQINRQITASFIHIYWYWQIKSSYNAQKKVTLWNETYVFDDKDWNYNLITYYITDKDSSQSFFDEAKKNNIRITEKKNKWKHKNTLKQNYYTKENRYNRYNKNNTKK